MPIFAALDGVVVATHDGEPDTNTQALGQPSNYVMLSHGNGHQSWYWHLKRNSVAVAQGQVVTAGTQLGLAGSSGNSTWPHLRLESQVDGVAYEPSAGPCRTGPGYWVNQVPVRRATFVRTFTFANDPQNGVWRITYTRPDSSLAVDFSGTFNGSFRSGWLWFSVNPGGGLNAVGTWTARFYVNNVVLATAPFHVVASSGDVVNRAPLGVAVSLDPPEPTESDVPFCRVTPAVLYRRDPDYDVVRYRYVWAINGALVRDVWSAALSDAIPKGLVSAGDIVTCTVVPADDSGAAGPWTRATSCRRSTTASSSSTVCLCRPGRPIRRRSSRILEQRSRPACRCSRASTSATAAVPGNESAYWCSTPASATCPSARSGCRRARRCAPIYMRTHTTRAWTNGAIYFFYVATAGSAGGAYGVDNVSLHDHDFLDLSACTFWLEPGQPLSNYAVRTSATKAWVNATISFDPATARTDEWIRLDRVALQRTPGATIAGTECVEAAP